MGFTVRCETNGWCLLCVNDMIMRIIAVTGTVEKPDSDQNMHGWTVTGRSGSVFSTVKRLVFIKRTGPVHRPDLENLLSQNGQGR